MRKSKIFITRNAWQHNDFGGAEELALNIVDSLSTAGHEAYLVTGSAKLIARADEQRTPYIRGPFSTHQVLTKHRAVFIPAYLIDLFEAYKAYLQLFSQHSPDIVHTTGQQDSIAATAAATKLGIPVVWSDHGELKNSLKFSFMPPWGIPGRLLSKQIKKISALFMINDSDIEFVKALFPSVPIKVVPNGVLDLYDPGLRRNETFVFASRLIKEKGIFELIEAARILKRQSLPFKISIAGDGPSKNIIAREIKKDLSDSIILTNYSDAVIESAAIFILPTYTEAQSLALIKAMMYKTPIITTSIEGNVHFLTHNRNAILVKPRDSLNLAEAIRNLSTNPGLRRKITEAARKDYVEKFDLDMVIKKYYIPIYCKVFKKDA